MKKLLILSLIGLLILSTVAGGMACSSNNSGSSSDLDSLMKKIPKGVSSFSFVDLEALRGDEDLEPLIHNFTNLPDFYLNGVDNDVNYFVTYEHAAILYGDFNLDDIRTKFGDQGYTVGDYSGVEIWESHDGYTWVAITGDLIIVGDMNNVKDCIDVIEDGEDSIMDDNDCKDIINRLPSGFVMGYTTQQEQYSGEEAAGATYQKKDADTIKVSVVFKFDNEDAAENALDEIENEFEGETGFYNIYMVQNGEYVEGNFEADIDDVFGHD